jgi:hypothetical protein
MTKKAAFGRLFCYCADVHPRTCKTMFQRLAAIRQNPVARRFQARAR